MADAPADNPLRRLAALGQSVWLDDIRRGLLEDGTLARMIREDGLAGVTSNPAIFAQAIGGSADYDAALAKLARDGADAGAIYAALTREDVGRAADLFLPLWTASAGRDGYVSIEVSPHLARDTAGTIAEARALWDALARPNVMIKVPGTREGLPAIRALIAAGLNLNVTLLFSVARCREVAGAHAAGLEDRLARGLPLSPVASVASFFVSRIDTHVDALLDRLGSPDARALRGRAAVACAKLAARAAREFAGSARWLSLQAAGGRSQRLLWASTGTKDPAYPDLAYVEPLVGAGTVNTMPPATLAACRDHGRPEPVLDRDIDSAVEVVRRLEALGIAPDAVAARLEEEGIVKFAEPHDALLRTIEARRAALAGG